MPPGGVSIREGILCSPGTVVLQPGQTPKLKEGISTENSDNEDAKPKTHLKFYAERHVFHRFLLLFESEWWPRTSLFELVKSSTGSPLALYQPVGANSIGKTIFDRPESSPTALWHRARILLKGESGF